MIEKTTLIKQLNADRLKLILLIPFFATFVTVFIVSGNLINGIVTGKHFWFYGCMGLVSLATLIIVILNKKRLQFSILDLLILFFVGSVYLSALIFNDASQNTTKLTLLALLTVLYLGFRLVDKKHFFCVFIIITGLVEAIWGIMQIYGLTDSYHNLFKVTGSFFNPGPYGGYLAVVFPVSLYYWLHGMQFRLRVLAIAVKWIAGITCIVILWVLPATMSRASWLAVITGSIAVIYTYYSSRLAMKEYYSHYKKKIRIIGFVVVLLLLVAFAGVYFLKRNSADGRLFTWKISMQAALKRPFGVGLGNFPSAYGEAQVDYFTLEKASEKEELIADCPGFGFNEYLQILTESGIISFLLFVTIIILALKSMIKKRDWGILGAMISMLVFAFFSYPFNVLPFLIVFVFLLAVSGSENKETDKLAHSPAILLFCLCLFVSCFCLHKQYYVYEAHKKWSQNRNNYNVEQYESLYTLLNDQTLFLFDYTQILSKSGKYEKNYEALQRAMQLSCDPIWTNLMGRNYQVMKEYDKAEAFFKKAAKLVPSRLYPHYMLAKLYHEMGLKDKAEAETNIVLTKPPKVESEAVEEMRKELIRDKR
jgi:tetratricopeptide (TPR) repeat protein